MRIGYVTTKSNKRKLEGSLHWCHKNDIFTVFFLLYNNQGSFLLSSKTYLSFNIL